MSDQLLLISVGNTRTRFAVVRNGQLEPSRVEPNADRAALAAAVLGAAGGTESDGPAPALIASVNRPVSDRLEEALRGSGRRTWKLSAGGAEGRIGEGELPIPITHTLDDLTTVGPDRLLDAIGAYSRAKQACVVVDAGTAITVDFVDGEGTFHGGAIAPGVRMMLDAMHERTAGLPKVAVSADLLPPAKVDRQHPPFGRSTAPAMVLGAVSAARGAVHLLIDRYAQFYEAYPRIIATGGDAPMLFENDELVEHIVPDLTLVGMLEAYRRLEQMEDESGGGDAGAAPGEA